jgi:hypothetical protein
VRRKEKLAHTYLFGGLLIYAQELLAERIDPETDS